LSEEKERYLLYKVKRKPLFDKTSCKKEEYGRRKKGTWIKKGERIRSRRMKRGEGGKCFFYIEWGEGLHCKESYKRK
jgi:hypothetical protein